jgi:photosystem II stability/assembly factor-like uncharacterized protein
VQAATFYNSIFITKNGGGHWNEILSNLNLSAVQQLIFVDENRGFLLMNTNNGETHELYRTVDAGKTWSLISPSKGTIVQQPMKTAE